MDVNRCTPGRSHRRVLTPTERGVRIREGRCRAREDRVEGCEQVPVAPFRREFQIQHRHDPETAGRLCRDLGFLRSRRGCNGRWPDHTRLYRLLGIKPNGTDKRMVGQPTYREAIPYDLAVRLMDLLGLDPTSAGV